MKIDAKRVDYASTEAILSLERPEATLDKALVDLCKFTDQSNMQKVTDFIGTRYSPWRYVEV